MSSALTPAKSSRLGNNFGLAFNAGREYPTLRVAVVVDRRSKNHSAMLSRLPAHLLAAAVRRFPGHFRKRSRSICHRTPGSVRPRRNLSFAVDISESVRDFDSYAARQSQVALEVEQALAGKVNCDQRRGAGGLHIDARATQVELVGNTSGQDILVITRLFELK